MPQVFGDDHDANDRRWVEREKRKRDRVVRESLARKKGELSAAETELRIWKRKLSKLESQLGAVWGARVLDQAQRPQSLGLNATTSLPMSLFSRSQLPRGALNLPSSLQFQ